MIFAKHIPGIFGAICLAAISLQAVKPVPAMAADECTNLLEQGHDLDKRNYAIRAKMLAAKSKTISYYNNNERNLMMVNATDFKIYMIEYLGLIIEQRTYLQQALEDGLVDRCQADKEGFKKLFYESFKLEEQYNTDIANITKMLNVENTTNSSDATY